VQVLLNLILNAVDATEKGGRIEIRAVSEQGELRIEISDNGPGVAPDHVDRLFQPYFTTKKHGTGLGLFVTRKLVSDHGGTVQFSSQAGGGTVFSVRLPVRPEIPEVREYVSPLSPARPASLVPEPAAGGTA
jgi:signal transduction histidine kinase